MKIALLMMHGKVHQHVGGAPRVFFDMANHFSESGHQVLAIYNDERDGQPHYQVNPDVQIHNLSLPKKFKGVKKYKLLREVLRTIDKIPNIDIKYNPVTLQFQKQAGEAAALLLKTFQADVVIAYHVSDLVSLRYSRFNSRKTLVMCHTDPSRVYRGLANYERSVWEQADSIQVLLPSYREALEQSVSAPIEVIGNVVPQFDLSADLSKKRIIYLARIEKNKRQHLIVEAMHRINETVRDGWTVALYGSCNDIAYQQSVQDSIERYGLEGIVTLMGATSSPIDELAKSSICAFPSAFEGFPLALTEAMSIGLPCVGFSECSGVNELMEHQTTGFLADNVEEFANILSRLMESEALREQVGQSAQCSVSAYSKEAIWKQWHSLMTRQ